MTDKNIQEAEVGSGTKITDTKQSEKRAQITLKAIQLRLKQEKERAALQQQKKSLRVKEDIEESFSPSQIAALKAEYSKINGIDPSSDTYKKLIAMLDRLDLKSLKSLAGAEIKFVSKLAQNRVARKSMKEEVQLDELSTNKLADYKKKAGEDASKADKEGDTKKGNKRFSGIMKATRKQFDNDAKGEKNEELSPKQKAIDKNKNGKIDGFDLSHLRKKTEELSPKQKALDKNKNGKIDGTDLAKLRKEEVDLQEKSDYEVYHKDYSSAVQTAIKQAEKRGFEVDMDDWHDKVATGPKKPSSGKTNSFSVKLKKDGKESKKALHLQVYNMDNHKYELNMYIESLEEGTQRVDSLVTDALKIMKGSELKDAVQALKTVIGDREYNDRRGHYNFYVKQLVDMYGKRDVKEAASPAQQAAIAIAMKKAGKKPKDMEESDAYDKDVKPSDKPHDKEAAAKRAKLAALAARKKMAEGLMDKIKAIKRGAEAKSKADDHFDKAGDPKNANASKDLKKAVRYHNLLNKEENGIQANAVTKHVTKGEITKSGVAKWLAEPNKKVKKEEAVPEFKSGGPELAKKFNKSFKSLGVNAKVKIKTVGNVSVNEEEITEAKKKSWKDMRKKTKNEEVPNKATVKKGDQLTGKREPIEINPELKDTAK
jgi:hypothetical protein